VGGFHRGGTARVTFEDAWDILRREIGTDAAARACHALIREAGGENLYIPRRPPPVEVKQTDTPKTLQAQGVSRRTAYRWVNSWKR